MNCSACLDRCKADCCRGPIPMPRTTFDAHPQVRPATHIMDAGPGMVAVMHVNENREAICPFLGLDNRCSIYAHRPEVCQLFGTEVAPQLVCSFQATDGRMRGRQERRGIDRQHVENKYRTGR